MKFISSPHAKIFSWVLPQTIPNLIPEPLWGEVLFILMFTNEETEVQRFWSFVEELWSSKMQRPFCVLRALFPLHFSGLLKILANVMKQRFGKHPLRCRTIIPIPKSVHSKIAHGHSPEGVVCRERRGKRGLTTHLLVTSLLYNT